MKEEGDANGHCDQAVSLNCNLLLIYETFGVGTRAKPYKLVSRDRQSKKCGDFTFLASTYVGRWPSLSLPQDHLTALVLCSRFTRVLTQILNPTC